LTVLHLGGQSRELSLITLISSSLAEGTVLKSLLGLTLPERDDRESAKVLWGVC
jgi:hypothetical protein